MESSHNQVPALMGEVQSLLVPRSPCESIRNLQQNWVINGMFHGEKGTWGIFPPLSADTWPLQELREGLQIKLCKEPALPLQPKSKKKLNKYALGQLKCFVQSRIRCFTSDPLGDCGKDENMLYLLVKMKHTLQWKILIFLKLFFIFVVFQPELIANYAANLQVCSADPKLSVSSGVGQEIIEIFRSE